MPIYEFECTDCRTSFEYRTSRVGERAESCPTCGGGKIEKLMSTFAAHTGDGRVASPPCESSGSAVAPCAMGASCGRFTGDCPS